MPADAEVVVAASPEEAIAAFGDGSGVTVVAGGTIVMPELNAGRLKPKKALLLGRAGLDGVTRANGTVTIGAGTPIAALEDADEPLATAARHVGDREIRAQATLGGNVCAAPGDPPRGDLQAPLLALGATARSTGKGGEKSEPLEDFLAKSAGRLLLDVSYDDASRQTAYTAAWRPHAHHYTILAVTAARRDDELRLAATGVAPHAVLLDADDPLAGLDLVDDALASGWYRERMLPVLVSRALAEVGA
jgi:aerobic carbon-monoxide dehydrogenase medium subunit